MSLQRPSRLQIVADKNIPFLKGIGEQFGDITYLAGAEFTKEAIKDADALIVRTVIHFDENLLEGSRVKLICSATIGYDHIDTDYCDRKGIIWKNAPGCNSQSVQQFITSSLIVIARKKGFELKDKTIGIVGVGNVGSKVAKACEALGMRVLLNDPPRERSEGAENFVSLDYIKENADIITFHTPLIKDGIDKTHHLANSDFFKTLSHNPIIINSARGGIIETEVVKMALKENLISGAIIDCWEKEPTIDLEYLKSVDQASPHIAGYSADGKANATRMSLAALADRFKMPKDSLQLIGIARPEKPLIDLNELSGNRVEEAILKTYNPQYDNDSLLEAPEKFTELRATYPLRREYSAYKVLNASAEESVVLQKLGFKLG